MIILQLILSALWGWLLHVLTYRHTARLSVRYGSMARSGIGIIGILGPGLAVYTSLKRAGLSAWLAYVIGTFLAAVSMGLGVFGGHFLDALRGDE